MIVPANVAPDYIADLMPATANYIMFAFQRPVNTVMDYQNNGSSGIDGLGGFGSGVTHL